MTFFYPTDDDNAGDPVQALWRMECEARREREKAPAAGEDDGGKFKL